MNPLGKSLLAAAWLVIIGLAFSGATAQEPAWMKATLSVEGMT